jgi:hypothetical protein
MFFQLNWPEPETSYVFVSRMLDDVCKSAMFYAEKMYAKAAESASQLDDMEQVRSNLDFQKIQNVLLLSSSEHKDQS